MTAHSVIHDRFGLAIGRSGPGFAAPGPLHQHEEVEWVYVEAGAVTYLLAQREVTIPAGRLTVFWAGFPHQVLRATKAKSFTWVTLPLETFWEWRLPTRFKQAILAGQIAMEESPQHRELDACLLRHWYRDLRSKTGVATDS